MLSLPTGHYVNTYTPLEKKAAISAQPVGRDASYCGEHSGGRGHQRKITEVHYLDMALHRQNHSVLL